jgi:Zn ribbon nucleic-acid-binding protein
MLRFQLVPDISQCVKCGYDELDKVTTIGDPENAWLFCMMCGHIHRNGDDGIKSYMETTENPFDELRRGGEGG